MRSLAIEYIGKFALDFLYEDWSVDFRDWLHVAYLRVIESADQRSTSTIGSFDAGVAHSAESVSRSTRDMTNSSSPCFRLLRNSGAHSAAAEQFAAVREVLPRQTSESSRRP